MRNSAGAKTHPNPRENKECKLWWEFWAPRPSKPNSRPPKDPWRPSSSLPPSPKTSQEGMVAARVGWWGEREGEGSNGGFARRGLRKGFTHHSVMEPPDHGNVCYQNNDLIQKRVKMSECHFRRLHHEVKVGYCKTSFNTPLSSMFVVG